jgi:hypothetical protein
MKERSKPRNRRRKNGVLVVNRWTVLDPQVTTTKAVKDYSLREGITIGRALDELIEAGVKYLESSEQ